MADTKKPEPVVRVTENPFGEFSEEQMAGKPLADRFYLKGYSDVRHERDIETQKAIKAGKTPVLKPLEHRFQYVPYQRPDGSVNKTQYVEWVGRGYRAVKWDELESLGINAAESTCEKAPDGNAIVGSQLLMVADAATAARRFREQRELTENQAKDVQVKFVEATDNYNAKMGRDKKTGTKAYFEEHTEVRKERR